MRCSKGVQPLQSVRCNQSGRLQPLLCCKSLQSLQPMFGSESL